MSINDKRKKVYIICCQGEYQVVWEHLNELIDVKKEELIVPYKFLQFDKLNQYLNEISLKQKITLEEAYAIWLQEKINYFKKFSPMAEEVIILDSNYTECKKEDILEKKAEIEECSKKRFKNVTFRSLNLLEKEKQKVIKP